MNVRKPSAVSGVGLGLRRDLMDALLDFPGVTDQVNFLEVAPENWIGLGGRWRLDFAAYAERFPIIAHGLSLSLGGPAPLDEVFILAVKNFLTKFNVPCYSEHLSYCSDDGHLYDLMPIPFTEEAVRHVSNRIDRVQTLLDRRIAIENVSYYAAPGQQMSEIEFLNAVLSTADCDLLLDVNNIYVNSVNHGYDPREFIDQIPAQRIVYAHVAGHHQEAEDLIIDTHGADVIDPVWDLLAYTYQRFGNIPTLLERDFNIPPITELLGEIARIRQLQQAQSAPCRTVSEL